MSGRPGLRPGWMVTRRPTGVAARPRRGNPCAIDHDLAVVNAQVVPRSGLRGIPQGGTNPRAGVMGLGDPGGNTAAFVHTDAMLTA
jgi:hypothetical protein